MSLSEVIRPLDFQQDQSLFPNGDFNLVETILYVGLKTLPFQTDFYREFKNHE